MFKNYLLVAYRNLVRYKVYSAINIVGLVIGIAFCILTFLYVRNEWTYDAFHENADRIYRVYVVGKISNGEVVKRHGTLIHVAPALKMNIPEVEQAVRVAAGGYELEDRELRFQVGEEIYIEEPLFVDPAFFEVFSFSLIKGDPKQVLAERNSVVLTHSVAEIFFKGEDPVGKTVLIRSQANHKMEPFVVTGLAADPPQNSSLKFRVIVAFAGTEPLFYWKPDDVKGYESCHTYLLLNDKTQLTTLEKKISSIVGEILPPREKMPDGPECHLQNITRLHFDTGFLNWTMHGTEPPVNPVYSQLLVGIAGLILLIASINYVNLSVGRSTTRALEVGVRRVVGANRRQIWKQFLGESLFLTTISLGLGLVLAELALPTFNNLVQRSLGVEQTWNVFTVGFVVVLAIVVGIAGGIYPAFVASGVHLVAVLKNRRVVIGPRFLGRIFVVFQFVISIFLVISAGVMFRQMTFVQNKDLGFDQNLLVSLWVDALPEMGKQREVLKNSLISYHRIEGIASARYNVLDNRPDAVEIPGRDDLRLKMFYVDYDFVKTLKMQIVNGRDFDAKEDGVKSGPMIVNETFVREMGWDDPIGQTIQFTGNGARLLRRSKGLVRVVGVMKDFHFLSLHHKVEPTAFLLNPSVVNEQDHFLVRIRPDDIAGTLAFMKEKWHEVTPHDIFRYDFLDEYIAKYYAEEARWERIVGYGALLAVLVACLGAFGLTSLAVTRRMKEIGIRKVLGASVPSIMSLLSKEFVLLVGIANVIAWPVAWWVMNRWLSDFAYRIELGIGTFVLGGLLTFLVVVGTVSVQAFQAARMNPVEALRYE